MQQQAEIPSVHRRDAEPHEARCAVAQVVRDPSPSRHAILAEQRRGDLAMRGAGQLSVERAKREDQTITPRAGKGGWIGAGVTPEETSPKPLGR